MISISAKRLRLFYYANVVLVIALIGHQLYLNLVEPRFESVHSEQVQRIGETLKDKNKFSFAVVGNVKNSARVFPEEIVPRLNAGDYAFVVSAGNAVSSGNEENYRAIYQVFERLNMPYLLTFGRREGEDFGEFRFYQYFGPHFFSFVAGNSHFLFLDATGKTPPSWQLGWLERELSASRTEHRFVFIGMPLMLPSVEVPPFEQNNTLEDTDFSAKLRQVFARHQVDAVFSANLTLYDDQHLDSVRYVVTGGAGGLVLDPEQSFHHYVKVNVAGDQLTIEPQLLEVAEPGWLGRLDNIWSSIYSFFYVSYPRFLLLVSLLIVSAIKLHRLVFKRRDYYPNFDINPAPYLGVPLRVAMFTNNYFPFVSGVSVSVARLKRGLEQQGHRILAVVPRYSSDRDADSEQDSSLVRLPKLYAFGKQGDFPLANLFLPRVYRRIKAFKPHLVHVHHPFWVGSLGLWLGKRLGVPVVYTYHTRLEHYAHYVPLPGLLFRNLICHYMIKRFANKCSGVVVPTYSAEEYLRIIGVKSRILVQPTGVEFDRFQHPDAEQLNRLKVRHGLKDERVLVSVSRLGREKNIDFMLEALAQLPADTLRTIKLLLIGEGPDRARLEGRIASLGLSAQVILAGSVPPEEMPGYYQLGDVFVFASKSETQGMVILEAMSAGLPVVAVRSSGIDDVVKQEFNGFKTAEEPRAWRDALERLLQEPELRKRLGEQARDFARNYDVAEFAHQVHEFYAKLLAEAKAPMEKVDQSQRSESEAGDA